MVGVFLVVAVLSLSPSRRPAHAQDYQAQFEFHECPDDIEYPPNRTIDCGTLLVPENRADPDGNQVRLPVWIFRHRFGGGTPDPIVYLAGGPGGSASGLIPSFDFLMGPLNIYRDVIIFDQRGTGRAEPSLHCRPFGLAAYEAYAQPFELEEGANHAADALIDCYEDYRAQGIDVNQYTSRTNAADINDLRLALELEQINLFGISYGTRLALTVVRDFPEALRSVVIDSVDPPRVRLYPETPANGAAAIDGLFRLCAADPACDAAYPDLEAKFYEVVERLNAEPQLLEVRRPRDGEYYDAYLDGDLFVGAIFWNLYSTTAITYLPEVIDEAWRGFYGPLRQNLLPGYFVWDGNLATVMHYAVNCNEEIIFDSLEDLDRAGDSLDPRLQGFFDVDNYMTYAICQRWEANEPDPRENDPVFSQIPTLILTGELDPITPPRWGELAAETLENAYVFMVAGAGHAVTFAHECPMDMARRFFEDPTVPPDDYCLAQISGPRFYIDPD